MQKSKNFTFLSCVQPMDIVPIIINRALHAASIFHGQVLWWQPNVLHLCNEYIHDSVCGTFVTTVSS